MKLFKYRLKNFDIILIRLLKHIYFDIQIFNYIFKKYIFLIF